MKNWRPKSFIREFREFFPVEQLYILQDLDNQISSYNKNNGFIFKRQGIVLGAIAVGSFNFELFNSFQSYILSENGKRNIRHIQHVSTYSIYPSLCEMGLDTQFHTWVPLKEFCDHLYKMDRLIEKVYKLKAFT